MYVYNTRLRSLDNAPSCSSEKPCVNERILSKSFQTMRMRATQASNAMCLTNAEQGPIMTEV